MLSKEEMQQYFDTALEHLRKQGERAFDRETEMCLYRAPNGTKCAVGSFISDEDYNETFENNDAESVMGTVLKRELGAEESLFFMEMQSYMHDDCIDGPDFYKHLESGAQYVAGCYELEYTGPK